MHNLRYLTAFLILSSSLSVQGTYLSQDSLKANYRPPWQLKGLKSVTLIATVISPNFPNDVTVIEQKLEKLAQKKIRKAGLSLEGEQGAFLCITVGSYPVNEKILRNHLIVQIRTQLSEESILKRNPALEDQNYTTWEYDWTELMRLEVLESFILKEASDQIEQFCSDWQFVNDKDDIILQ